MYKMVPRLNSITKLVYSVGFLFDGIFLKAGVLLFLFTFNVYVCKALLLVIVVSIIVRFSLYISFHLYYWFLSSLIFLTFIMVVILFCLI